MTDWNLQRVGHHPRWIVDLRGLVIWSISASAFLTLVGTRFLARHRRRTTGANFALALAAAASCLHAIETYAAKVSFRANSDYLIDAWETEDGLPENSATSLVQTPDGYLWFGTFNGLVRFDGVKFTVFNPGNTPALPSASIVNLHLDKNRRLWVSTERGLVVRDGNAGAKWRTFGPKEGWAGNYVRMFAERANGDLLITTFDGHVLEFVNDRLTELPQPPGEVGAGYLGWADESGQWWVIQSQFIGRWDGARWVPTLSSPEIPLKKGVTLGCAPARDGGLWLLLNLELRKYSHGKEVSRRQVPNDAEGMLGSVSSMSEDSLGNVWISTFEAGLTQVLPAGTLRRWYEPNGISYSDVRFVSEDREKNLWVGTSGGGLMRFKPRRFQSFGGTSQAPLRAVNSVWPASAGGLWIATFGRGLFRLGEEGNIVLRPDDDPQHNRFFQSVLTDRVGRTWYGMLEKGLYMFDEKVVRHIPGEQTGGKDVKALFEDSQGQVWISGGRGISVFSAGVFRVFGPEQGLPVGAVCGFAEDRDGRIWASNLDGVFRLETDRFVEVQDGGRRPLREIVCLKSDADGTMWMGSLSVGLLRWREGSLATIGADAGFPVRSVQGILEDDQGYFWMASNRGVVRVPRKELQSVADGVASSLVCQLLDLSDGLPSVECPSHRQPVCARDASGRLWFATVKGVAMIDPARFRPNTLPPPVHIEEVIYHYGAQGAGVSDRTEQRLSAPFLEELKLPAGSRRLEIHFTAPSLVAPEKVRFETKVEGKDSRWQAVGNRRVAFFDEPQPGHHMFRVRAANNDGVWNEAGTSLAFTVLPFYWQTSWFRLAAGLLLVATGGGAVLWQTRAKRRHELVEMEHLRKVSADRKRADERFRLAVEASPNGIILVNDQGRMVLVNEETERLFGYSRPDLIGQTVEMLVPERSSGAHPGHRAGFFAEPRTRAMGAGRELFALRKDGSEFPVEVGLSSIQSEEGLFILAVIVDITARKRAELEIAERRKEVAHLSRVTTLGEISGSLAHELSQPLGAILNNTDSIEMHLQRPTPDLDEVRAILADIRQDDLRAGDIIHGMRAFLRRRELVMQPLELGHLAGEAVRLVGGDAATRQIAIGLEIPPALPLVTGDRIHLQQVLVNLLVNGMDAVNTSVAPYRRITIRATQANPDAVEITVSDAGIGIPPGSLSQIFEPFHTTKPGGLGLGLAICRSIIEAHGGAIVIENNTDRGATARVTLPVCNEKGSEGALVTSNR